MGLPRKEVKTHTLNNQDWLKCSRASESTLFDEVWNFFVIVLTITSETIQKRQSTVMEIRGPNIVLVMIWWSRTYLLMSCEKSTVHCSWACTRPLKEWKFLCICKVTGRDHWHEITFPGPSHCKEISFSYGLHTSIRCFYWVNNFFSYYWCLLRTL